MSKKWTCDGCGEVYKTKKQLVECLEEHVAENYQELMIIEAQLGELGIKEYTIT